MHTENLFKFLEMELSSPKKLRRNWMLEQPLDFTGCSNIQFFNSPLPLTQLVRLPGVTYHLLCSSCVTYGTLCHAIGHQVFPTNTCLGKQRFSLGMASILIMCSANMANLLPAKVLLMC